MKIWRRSPIVAVLIVMSGSIGGIGRSSDAKGISFDECVEAQMAIERAYDTRRTGRTRPLDEHLLRSVAEAKVRSYLKQSLALERFWNVRITAEALQAELSRIIRNTRFPERLVEIFASLGDDPVIIQECFVRPILAERLSRNFFAYDRRVHGPERSQALTLRDEVVRGSLDSRAWTAWPKVVEVVAADGQPGDNRPSENLVVVTAEEFERIRNLWPRWLNEAGALQERREDFVFGTVLEEGPGRFRAALHSIPKRTWEEWWVSVEEAFDESEVEPVALFVTLPPHDPQATCGPDDVWDNGALSIPAEGRLGHTAVWTGSEMLVWGGIDVFQASQTPVRGFRYDPLIDSWRFISTGNAPQGRFRHTAVWTGDEMIVWGGESHGLLNTGGRYDPVTDTWTPTSAINAPSARDTHRSIWTGTEMIVWGGPLAGGRYDPATDTWSATSTINAPAARSGHTAIWTGSEMIVWGGFASGSYTTTGGRYDPVADAWTATSTTNAPTGRSDHTVVWTGGEMILWGGTGDSSGGRYDPISNSWTPTSTLGAPVPRLFATAAWTGERMIVWGGMDSGTSALQSGGLYDPVSDTWAPMSQVNAPDRRMNHTAVWTGDRMIVWGGASDFNEGILRTGGRYDPVSDSWTPTMGTSNQPTPRLEHTAVWTGAEMILWGGGDVYGDFNSGGRYDPLIDAWRSMSVSDAPLQRSFHTAVWTGTEMVVWGGRAFALGLGPFASGGRYDPVTDSWRPTSMTDAPAARFLHRAVWTGTKMIVWGGDAGGLIPGATGGGYDPVADRWTAVSGTNAPSGRQRHTATWTGSEMIVWGGYFGMEALGTGARYDPVTDSWTATSLAGAPSARRDHTAVWTGDRLIVWGGGTNSGALYDPVADAWEATSTANAPAPRAGHTAVWTGRLMIVHGGNPGRNTGGRYDPNRDSWTPTSVLNAPYSQLGHTSVWTLGQMLVWGDGGVFGTGGRYLVDTSPDADQDGFTTCEGDCDDSRPTVYAGAPEICDGINNDCSHPFWPGVAGTIEADDDGDALSECQGDCDDADAAAWRAPGAITTLEVADDSRLVWSPPTLPGATVVRYDTMRAAGPDFTMMTCVGADATVTTSIDTTVPSIGSILYYLARPQNACGLGSAGAASDGTERIIADCHPPGTPQGGPPFDQ